MTPLERFEALCFSQVPAEKPWEPVTDYSFSARTAIEGEHPDRITATFGTGPYLDYGCGPDAILIRLLRERGVIAWGIDPILKDEWKVFSPDWLVDGFSRKRWPVVMCREVLEHLTFRDLHATVKELCGRSRQFVYVTTRFAKDPSHLLNVDTSDDLDPTHITMLTQDFLRVLFVLEGFKRRADLEEQLDWMKKGRVLVYERV